MNFFNNAAATAGHQSTPEMIQKSQQQPQSQQQESSTKRGLTEEQTITMLHFFYLVRLSQQGFFSVIANAYPDLQVEALAYLCDKLVGNSLFLSTDAAAGVQKEKTKQVFDLLRKLHQGVDEPVGDDFTMTFKQVRDVMYNLVDKALQQPKMNGESSSLLPQPSPSEDSLQQQQQQQRRQQQSVWVVVPFTGMMDLTSIQLPSGTVPPPPPISAGTLYIYILLLLLCRTKSYAEAHCIRYNNINAKWNNNRLQQQQQTSTRLYSC